MSPYPPLPRPHTTIQDWPSAKWNCQGPCYWEFQDQESRALNWPQGPAHLHRLPAHDLPRFPLACSVHLPGCQSALLHHGPFTKSRPVCLCTAGPGLAPNPEPVPLLPDSSPNLQEAQLAARPAPSPCSAIGAIHFRGPDEAASLSLAPLTSHTPFLPVQLLTVTGLDPSTRPVLALALLSEPLGGSSKPHSRRTHRDHPHWEHGCQDAATPVSPASTDPSITEMQRSRRCWGGNTSDTARGGLSARACERHVRPVCDCVRLRLRLRLRDAGQVSLSTYLLNQTGPRQTTNASQKVKGTGLTSRKQHRTAFARGWSAELGGAASHVGRARPGKLPRCISMRAGRAPAWGSLLCV